jgi:hypothetical protein
MENPHMWDYWKDKRGSPSEALEADYPNLLKTSIRLQVALAQVKNGQDTIDRLMEEEGHTIRDAYSFESDGLSGILGQPFGSCGE